MSLKQDIAAWNGKSAADINVIYNRHLHDPSFISDIIILIEQVPLQKGATWLLKKHLETDGTLESKDVKRIYELLPKLEHWETKLHILQCIPFMPIANSEKKNVELFLRNCLVDGKKLVRAWAYNGFYELSVQHQAYQAETKQILETAMKDEAASVKARIRNITKKGF